MAREEAGADTARSPSGAPPGRLPGSMNARTIALLGAAALGGCHADAPAPPNVLIVSIDTLRADRLGCYGHDRPTSPVIDELAREGARFDDCQAPTSWTLPSHVTMLTGLPISVHGVCDHRLWTQPEHVGLARRGTFLAEHLKARGYATGGFYSWSFLDPQYGFGAGFDRYEGVGYSVATLPGIGDELQRLRAAGDLEAARELLIAHKDEIDPHQSNAHNVVDKALAWLDDVVPAPDDRPFFLFVHLFDVHDPYTPPPPFDERFDPDYDGPVDGRDVAKRNSPTVHPNMPARDLEHLLALYDGEIAWTDSQLGRLIARLRALGELDDTLVVVTSDHGEEFFEHGLKTHRKQLFKESVHVPLVLRLPGVVPAGTTIAAPVGLIDVAPTVLALCGVEAELPGRDLLAIAAGERAPRTLLAELQHFTSEFAHSPQRQLALRDGDRRVFRIADPDGTIEAFELDLAADPRELGERRAIEPGSDRWSELERRLDALRAELSAWRRRFRPVAIRPDELDAEELEALAAFGYVDGAAPVASEDASADVLCFDGCVW